MVTIENYNNIIHRQSVVKIWTELFNYKEERNKPENAIDKKIKFNDNLFFFALQDNIVIGTIMCGYDGHRGWIYSLAVTKDKQGKGIGTKLLKHAENTLKSIGCVKINIQILLTNQKVKEFYEKNGFTVEERISMGKLVE